MSKTFTYTLIAIITITITLMTIWSWKALVGLVIGAVLCYGLIIYALYDWEKTERNEHR